jgi:hypothetical protein
MLTQRTLAILEIALQRGRPRVDVFVCSHIIGDIIRWLRGHEQGGRIARHPFVGGAECVAIWQACDCHEEVRMAHSTEFMSHSPWTLDPVVRYFPVQEQSTYQPPEPRV